MWSGRFKQRPERGKRVTYGDIWGNFRAEGRARSKNLRLECAWRIQGITRRPVGLELSRGWGLERNRSVRSGGIMWRLRLMGHQWEILNKRFPWSYGYLMSSPGFCVEKGLEGARSRNRWLPESFRRNPGRSWLCWWELVRLSICYKYRDRTFFWMWGPREGEESRMTPGFRPKQYWKNVFTRMEKTVKGRDWQGCRVLEGNSSQFWMSCTWKFRVCSWISESGFLERIEAWRYKYENCCTMDGIWSHRIGWAYQGVVVDKGGKKGN